MENENNLKRLINKIRKGKIVLWAGAGFSFYAGVPMGNQLCKKIVENIKDKIDKKNLKIYLILCLKYHRGL